MLIVIPATDALHSNQDTSECVVVKHNLVDWFRSITAISHSQERRPASALSPRFELRLSYRIAHLCLLQIVPIAMVFVSPISRSLCGPVSDPEDFLSDGSNTLSVCDHDSHFSHFNRVVTLDECCRSI